MTECAAFRLRIRPDKMDEYVRAHADVWPEMLDALRAAGIRNYTIFRSGNDVFGYYECDDVGAAADFMAAQEVNTRWQKAMVPLLAERVDGATPPPLEPVFRLD
jgi:L-rhamnose mutarotase